MKYKASENFEQIFESMLEEMTAFLFAKFINKPTVNAIKYDIFKACAKLEQSPDYKYDFNINLDSDSFSQQISGHSSSKLTEALLLLHAYLHDNQASITFKPDIEHIFPKKWQNTNYNGWDKKDAEDFLESLGNKIILEKRLNIQAGNNYFGRKKEKYRQSAIEAVKELAHYPKDDWTKEDIIDRERKIKKDLVEFFRKNLFL